MVDIPLLQNGTLQCGGFIFSKMLVRGKELFFK